MATDVKNDPTLSTSLISYWELEEASGTRVDSHGSNDLTDNNTVGQGTGKQGNCADLESGNSEYFSITDASQSGLDVTTGDISVAMWVQFESQSGLIGLCYKGDTGFTDMNWRFEFDSDNDELSFRVAEAGAGNSTEEEVVSWNPSNSTWYHIGLAYDNSADTVDFYVNGSQQGSTQTFTVRTGTLNNSSGPFFLGSLGTGWYFDGLIDEVGVWNKVVSSSEFSDLYNGGNGIPYEASGGAVSTSTIMALTGVGM